MFQDDHKILQVEQLRQPHGKSGYIGDKHQPYEHGDKKWDHERRHSSNCRFSHPATQKQAGAYRWRAQADTKIGNHNNSEVDRINSQGFGNREKDRGEYQDCRGHVHERAHEQEQ